MIEEGWTGDTYVRRQWLEPITEERSDVTNSWVKLYVGEWKYGEESKTEHEVELSVADCYRRIVLDFGFTEGKQDVIKRRLAKIDRLIATLEVARAAIEDYQEKEVK